MADIASPHDRFFKTVFSQPEIAADFLASYLPEPVAALLDPDPAALVLIEGSFVDPDLSAHFSDLLYRVVLRDGEHAFVYVLFEHKSLPDPLVAFQVLRYKVRIWERLLRQGGGVRLVPIIPIVVHHGPKRWRVPLDFGALIDGPDPLRRYWPDFEYRLVDLSHCSASSRFEAPYWCRPACGGCATPRILCRSAACLRLSSWPGRPWARGRCWSV